MHAWNDWLSSLKVEGYALFHEVKSGLIVAVVLISTPCTFAAATKAFAPSIFQPFIRCMDLGLLGSFANPMLKA